MEEKAATTTLVLLCKRPAPGQGKQRLARTLGREPAYRLACGFLACALEDVREWPGPVVIAPAAPADRAWAVGLLDGAAVRAQGSGNLGARIVTLDRELRADGAQRLLYIGSDAPTLIPAHYRSARQGLTRSPVVLAAADDGGVVMMGAAHPWPELVDLPWSTPALGAALSDRCRSRGLSVSYLPPGYDIDVEADLGRLRDDLAGDQRPARQHLARLLETLARGGERSA